jgi:hypothetical protein
MPRWVTATLKRHSTKDGLVTVRDEVPLGKQYRVDLDSIRIEELGIDDIAHIDIDKHPSHKKELIETNDCGWLCTELLHIPEHNSKHIYTHKDKDGVLWRFEGGRPVSIIADEIMEEIE